MRQPRRSFEAYTPQEVEAENEREKEVLRKFYERNQPRPKKLLRWLRDRWRWLRWFSWN